MTNYFELLGLVPRYALDLADLEARYHERSRLHHPDRHAKADGAMRVRSALLTSELNQAYRVLRDPTRRAEYILRLHGIEAGDDRAGGVADSGFLMEMLELREALAEAQARRDAGGEATVRVLAGEVQRRRDLALQQVANGFAAFDAGDRASLPAIAAGLVTRRYFQRFLDEIEAHHERADAAGQEG